MLTIVGEHSDVPGDHSLRGKLCSPDVAVMVRGYLRTLTR